MPTYEYRCPVGHEFERFQKMSDDPVADCPECGEAAERLLSGGAGFLFKGSGFYITDYRSDSYRAAAKADGTRDGGGSKAKGDAGGSGGSGEASSGKSGGSGEAPSGKSGGSGEASGGKSGGTGSRPSSGAGD